jgi:sucrose phosphorylase
MERLPRGVIFNAYPDSIGEKLSDTVGMLKRPEFEGVFSLFYILPTFFHSDLDRGFSVIDYDLNEELVSPEDIKDLKDLEITLKLDLVLNHLSVNSPQFKDLRNRGEDSDYENFFIDWNEFWKDHGTTGEEGYTIPDAAFREKLFTRKPGLPVMKVCFPDGADRFFWNTFYKEISYERISLQEIAAETGISAADSEKLASRINEALSSGSRPDQINLSPHSDYREQLMEIIEKKRRYLGQLDLNAQSEKVWLFYDQTLKKLRSYGAKIIRLDAFAYLHKEPGQPNFFNRPGTWEYLERIKNLARKYDLIVLPEIHSEYGSGLHEEIAAEGYPIYDFFFPGLVIDAIERGTGERLLEWIDEIVEKKIETINMLGCHDGIPVLDLRGKEISGFYRPGLLSDEQIAAAVKLITERGGRTKNLYGPDGEKISYYQVNATFFSALGEDERKLRLARAIQLFMPGTPQIWYLDIFAGSNNYEAADRAGTAGHKEINRTNLTIQEIEEGLKRPVVRDQLDMIRMRNTSPAFNGTLEVNRKSEISLLELCWRHQGYEALLTADLKAHSFQIRHRDDCGEQKFISCSWPA